MIIYPNDKDFWKPEAFLPMTKVRTKSGSIEPFKLWDQQMILAAAVTRCYQENKWLVHVKPRQEGSSTFFTGVGVQHAAFRTGCRVGILAHKKVQSQYLSSVAVRFHRYMPDEIRPKKTPGLKRSLEFPEIDSRMTIASVKDDEPLRGETVQVLLATEISAWSETGGTDAWTAALNAVPGDGGFVIAESTPRHHGDQLHLVCIDAESPDSKWMKVFIPWTIVQEYKKQPPPGWKPRSDVRDYMDQHRIPEDSAYWMQTVGLEKCRNDLMKFRAEYPVNELDCWILAGDAVYNAQKLMEMLEHIDGGTGISVETDEWVVFEEPRKGSRYIIFVDPAGSWAKRDKFGVEIFDVDGCEQVAEYLGHAEAFRMARRLIEWAKSYNDARIYIEANGVGEAVLSHVIAMGYRNVYHRKASGYGISGKQRIPGWYSTAKTKAQAVGYLQELIDDGSITIRSVRCLRQLLNYRGQWDKLSRDASGGHYDLAAAVGGFAWAWRNEIGAQHQKRNMSPKQIENEAWRRLLNRIDRGSISKWDTPWGKHL